MDRIREQLPETVAYMQIDKRSAGSMTQKEAGVIAEIASEEALARHLNVWIDGSLQNAGSPNLPCRASHSSHKSTHLPHLTSLRPTPPRPTPPLRPVLSLPSPTPLL